MVKELLFEFFAILIREGCLTSYSTMDNYARESMDRFKDVFTYVNKNYHNRIMVKEAADIANMSEYRFRRIFKKLTGKTFIECLNFVRISKAEKLLAETDKKVPDICFEVGFNDVNYFTRVFKKLRTRIRPG